MLGYDCPLSLSVAYAPARPPIPCSLLPVRVLSSSSSTLWSFTLTPGLLGLPVRLFRIVYKETTGSPRFPGYPFDCMPRSPTPVVSSILALTHSGLLPSVRMKTSAFPLGCPPGYPMSTIIQISGLNYAACSLAPPGFGLPLPDLPAGFATSLSARLWLGGTCTHWVTSTNFYRLMPISQRSGLLLAQHALVGW